jgi:uncharacterized membrane protein YfcA
MFPVGAEVGFSSAGAGALGSAALLSLTPLEPAQVVGTDIVFGFLVSLIGSGAHWFSHASNPTLLLQLILGGVAGAIGGTLLSTHIPRRPLRFALWVWLLILGGQFLFNSYQVWASPSTHKSAAPVVRNPGASQQRSARMKAHVPRTGGPPNAVDAAMDASGRGVSSSQLIWHEAHRIESNCRHTTGAAKGAKR